MTVQRLALLTAFSFAVCAAPGAEARVLGGKNPASDCYLVFEGISGERPNVECTDGSACDADGEANGECKFQVSVCAFATGVEGCDPAPVTKIKGAKFLRNRPTPPITEPTCETPNEVVVKLKKKGRKPGKKKIKMTAITDGGSPKKDVNVFNLVCRPPSGGPLPGDRTFSIRWFGTTDPRGSHFLSSATNDTPIETAFDGAIHLTAGEPGPDGVATLVIAQDSYLHFNDLGNGSDCVKITAAGSQGKLDCDGGTAVGSKLTQDKATGTMVTMAELGAPGRPGDGYVRATVQAVTCGGILNTPGACTGSLPITAEECAEPGRIDYSKGFTYEGVALTTGEATAEITRGSQPPITISSTGTPFDCEAFTGENAPGTIVFPTTLLNINIGGGVILDVANIAVLVD